MTAHTQLWVYNSENRFVGLFYQFTCRVKRTKGLNDKTEFWDRLIDSLGFDLVVAPWPDADRALVSAVQGEVLPATRSYHDDENMRTR